MSERMIELQRLRLLQAGKGGNSAQTSQNGSQSGRSHGVAGVAAAQSRQMSPQQAAQAAIRNEEVQMQRFFQRLQQRDDNRGDSFSGPTVPTALSRRILHKQGAGYLDDTVASVISAGADRFLATVLQQAVACRDQRLTGAGMARDAARHRKRHLHQYQSDADDRRRRKQERYQQRERVNLAAIEAAEAIKKSGSSPAVKDDENATNKSKKKKPKMDDTPKPNGLRRKYNDDDDDDASYDSVDEEEKYYQDHYGDQAGDVDDEEDDDEMLVLRDFARPLAAWDLHVTGKVGMDPIPHHAQDEESIRDDEDEHDDIEQLQVDGDGGPASQADRETPSANSEKKAESRAASPVPTAAQAGNSTSK